jgi:SAM-dependent methyltransferase
MSESFDAGWLDLREPHDAMARDPGLAMALSRALPQRPRILDLGAGTGSLLRWLGHFIGRAQAWTLVDADASLIELAFDTIADRAETVGWSVTAPQRHVLLVHTPHGAWRVEGMVTDLAEIPDNLPLDQVDAVVSSALCDLVSEEWVEQLVPAIAEHRLPFYAALNVTDRARFAPPHPADALVARGFGRDQARDKGFLGTALGRDAPGVLAGAFEAEGYEVSRAPSPWVIHRRDSRMALALAEGHAEAALTQERRGARAIEAWRAARRAQAMGGRLSVRVPHQDLLALPGAD